MEMHLLSSFLLRQRELGTDGLRAQLIATIVQTGLDDRQVPLLLTKPGTERQPCIVGGDGLAETCLHLGSNASRLQLAKDHPTANLVQQDRLYAAVQGVQPALIFGPWRPPADYLVSILIKLHVQAGHIMGRASETIITVCFFPRIDYLFHGSKQIKLLIEI